MISKCSNIVINRTKFSDFEDFDITTESAEGLKLVGYIETVDMCTGETIKKNVAVEYPGNKVTIERPANYFIYSLASQPLNTEYIIKEIVSNDTVSYRVQSTFQGDFIQINFKEKDDEKLGTIFSKHEGLTCFNISFARDVEFGRTIKVLFRNFPIHKEGCALRLLDYAKTSEGFGSVPTSNVLLENNEKFSEIGHGLNFLITFNEVNTTESMGDSYNTRSMVATNIELID